MPGTRLIAAALLVSLLLVSGPHACAVDPGAEVPPPELHTAEAASDVDRDVPYVQTPPSVVHRMLEMADVGPGDVVYDLGSGDGRIPIAAVRDFGARRAVGVEIDPELVAEAREKAAAAGVAGRVRFIEGDLFEIDFSAASVLTLYLFPEINRRLRPEILSRLEPGTRVVSHAFGMGEWRPDAHATVDLSQIFMWLVPSRVTGRWSWRLDGERYGLVLRQQFQRVLGEVRAHGDAVHITEGTIAGRRVRFEVPTPGADGNGTLAFEGRVGDGRIRARVTVGGRTADVVVRRAD